MAAVVALVRTSVIIDGGVLSALIASPRDSDVSQDTELHTTAVQTIDRCTPWALKACPSTFDCNSVKF